MSYKPPSRKTPIASSIPAPTATINPSTFDALADSAFIREAQLVQSPKRPATPAPLPISAPTLWRRVKNGTWPTPVKLSERVSAWIVGECRAMNAAHIAGRSDAEIRQLVIELHAKRSQPAVEGAQP